MNIELIAGVAGFVLSLIFSYSPYLSKWYSKLSKDGKKWVMWSALFVTAFIFYGYQCYTAACPEPEQFINAFVFYFVANQATHQLTPKGLKNLFKQQ